MKFGVHIAIWDTPFRTREHLSLIARAKALGAEVFEFPMEPDSEIDPPAVRSAFQSEGMLFSTATMCGPGPGLFDEDPAERAHWLDHLKRSIDVAAEIGAGNFSFVAGGFSGSTRLSEQERRDGFARASDAARAAAEHAADAGLRLGAEVLNRYETNILSTVAEGVDFVNQVDHPAFGLHLDTFHMNIDEPRPGDAIRLVGDRLFHMHCADNQRAEPGTGTIDWGVIGAALRAVAFDRFAVIEMMNFSAPLAEVVRIWHPWGREPDDQARDGLAFLRSAFAG